MNRLKEIRLARNMSQEQLARKVDCTLGTIQNIENKDYSPSVYLAIKIKNALQCKLEDIFIVDTK